MLHSPTEIKPMLSSQSDYVDVVGQVSFLFFLPSCVLVDQPDFLFLTAVGALGERDQGPDAPQVHDWPGPGKGRDRSLAIL